MNARSMSLIASLCLIAACGDDKPVDLGSGATTPISQQGAGLSEFSGSWDGYAEGYNFSDGKDRVRLTVDASGNGTLQVGDSPAVAVPAANVGFPGIDGVHALNPGFAYPFSGATVESDRLQAAIESLGYYSAYCRQITPIAYRDGSYSCTPEPPAGAVPSNDNAGNECWYVSVTMDSSPLGVTTTELPGTRLPCGAFYCAQFCSCDSHGCTSRTYLSSTGYGSADGGFSLPSAPRSRDGGVVEAYGKVVELDGALEDNGAKLVGTLVFTDRETTNRIAVRLNRQ